MKIPPDPQETSKLMTLVEKYKRLDFNDERSEEPEIESS